MVGAKNLKREGVIGHTRLTNTMITKFESQGPERNETSSYFYIIELTHRLLDL